MTHIDVEILRTRARDGDPEAQFDLALRYSEGSGVPESAATAYRWLSKAAALGHVEAMGALGRCYHGGLGCPEDLGLAILWYDKALAAGADDIHGDLGQVLCDARAGEQRDVQRAIGLLLEGWERHEDAACAGILSEIYEDECGDEKASLEWARIAADAGDGAAMVTLGYRYRFGEGVPRDLKKMLHWYRRGADHGDATAIANLAICYQNGEGVKADAERAFALREEASDMGHAGSGTWLAFALVDGTGCEPDPERARALLEGLAKDDPEVAHDLADRLIDGPGLEQDVKGGLEWMQRAADCGYAPALTYLGVLSWYGKFMDEDRAVAMDLYQQAMELGDPYAVANVGFATLGGDEVTRDPRRGVELLVAAAEKGNAHAALWLAERWLEGAQDIPRDPSRAVEILEACVAEEEDGDVLFHLAELVRDGRGIERDLERAMDLFQLAEINGRDSRVERGQLRRELRRP
jgi:TPR repeat protein